MEKGEKTPGKKGTVAKWKAHPQFKHGAYSTKPLDRRTREGKAIERAIQALEADLPSRPNNAQLLLLGRIREKLLVLYRISSFVQDQTIINEKGELLPCLGTNYIAFSNAIRLDIQSFFELEKQKTHTGTPSLEDYIEAAKGKRTEGLT
jgi:hypothetical protein